MKKSTTGITLALTAAAMLLTAIDASAWCWKRENGRTTLDCGGLGFQMECCEGALEKWVSDTDEVTAEYRISTSTAVQRFPDVVSGFSKWNAIEMSTFRFERGADTNIWYEGRDSVNVINLDAEFCTHYPEYCGVGILGFSATFTRGEEATYKAVEADIILNGEDFDWGPEGSVDPIIDTVAVVAHESGHNAGLMHPGSGCRSGGSSGCGPEVEAATMYWNYSMGQPTNKASLELDDVAAMVAGYPRSTFRVKVIDTEEPPNPVSDAVVTVNGTAFPISVGTGALDPDDFDAVFPGGYVVGDVTSASTLVGDRVPDDSYLASAPHFSPTDANGYTEYKAPVTRSFLIKVQKGMASWTEECTVEDGQKTIDVRLDLSLGEDFGAPALNITSHTDGQVVTTESITLRGNATDAGFGDNGISMVTVNGVRAVNDTATAAGTTEWAYTLNLAEGPNRLEVIAEDDSSTPQWNVMTKTIMVRCDTTAPTVVESGPSALEVDPELAPAIIVRFSEALDPDTVTATNEAGAGNFTLTRRVGEATEVVYGAVTLDADTNTVVFAPDAMLAYATTYTLTATTGVTDAAGNPMAEDYALTVSTSAEAGSEDPGSNNGNVGGSAPDAGQKGGCFVETLLVR